MRNYCYENDFDLRENGRAGETYSHTNGFARGIVLKQRQRVTRKWPITSDAHHPCLVCVHQWGPDPTYARDIYKTVFAYSKQEYKYVWGAGGGRPVSRKEKVLTHG